MPFMKWLNANKGLSSTLNWIFSYSQQKNLFGKLALQPHSAHSPAFRRKAAFRAKRFTKKVLDTTPKLPISIPLARLFPKKVGKRANSIPIYTFVVKSALNPTSKDKLFSHTIQPIPLHFAEKLHSGQSASLQRSWTQLQSFRFLFRMPAYSREKLGSGQTPFPSTSLKSSPL